MLPMKKSLQQFRVAVVVVAEVAVQKTVPMKAVPMKIVRPNKKVAVVVAAKKLLN